MVRATPPEPPIEEIAERIVEAFHPRRIVLYGSRATTCGARADSDIDLMVEMETDLPWFDRMRAVDALFGLRRWAMDVIVFTPEEVREQRGYRNSIIHEIENKGRVLYEQS